MKQAASNPCTSVGRPQTLSAVVLVASIGLGVSSVRADASDEIPSTFGSRDHQVILSVHAVGEQIFECKAGASGPASWTFREPIATLVQDTKTVGRHYAGPNWDVAGGGVSGKLVASAPSATADSIPQLELRVAERRGAGPLDDAQWVLRLHTEGGVLTGACSPTGALKGVPYTADYLFLK